MQYEKIKVKDNPLSGRQSSHSQSTTNINQSSINKGPKIAVDQPLNNNVPPLISSNFINKNIKFEKQVEKDFFTKTPMIEINLKSYLRDNSKENNYIISNNSTEGNISKSKIEKINTKHQKHTSEIPQSFKNMAQLTEGNNSNTSKNCDKTFNQSSKSNIFDIYSQQQAQAFPKKINCFNLRDEIAQENEKKMLKTRSHNLIITQRDGSIGSVNRKITAPTTDAEVTDEIPNRFSLGPTHLSTNNTYNNTCNNCKDLKYNVLLSKYRQQEKDQKDILATIEILKSYIKTSQNETEKKKLDISEKFKKKSTENIRQMVNILFISRKKI
jgi:hypothetical protein